MADARLLVFVHVAVKQRALQNALQGALAGVLVTAVGRIGDLDRGLKDGSDAVLSLPLVLSARGLTPRLRGLRQSASDESYALVGVGAAPNPAGVKSVGALDILGREGTAAFVNGLLGRKPKVERVTKVEDLLPTLQMQVVDAILLPTRFVSDLRGASQLALIPTELPQRVALPAVASVGQRAEQVIAAVSQLSVGVLKNIGVDSWR